MELYQSLISSTPILERLRCGVSHRDGRAKAMACLDSTESREFQYRLCSLTVQFECGCHHTDSWFHCVGLPMFFEPWRMQMEEWVHQKAMRLSSKNEKFSTEGRMASMENRVKTESRSFSVRRTCSLKCFAVSGSRKRWSCRFSR